jgi:hypothetical protein
MVILHGIIKDAQVPAMNERLLNLSGIYHQTIISIKQSPIIVLLDEHYSESAGWALTGRVS